MEYPDLFPVSLRGDRVLLREFDVSDAAATFAWVSDPEFFRYMAAEVVESRAEEEAHLREVGAQARQQPRLLYRLGIVDTTTGGLVGVARIGISAPAQREGDIGYGVRRDHWGRGIATAAARLLLDFGFGDLGLHRLFACHDPRNTASERVLEKLGMRREGTLRENMFVHGVWCDSAVHGILEHEWAARGTR